MPATPASLHPLEKPTREALWVTSEVYEPLVALRARGEGHELALEPVLASSYRVLAGGEEIRFVLAQGVRFHDGRELTAEDARASLELARRSRAVRPGLRAALSRITSVSVWGPRDLRIYLHKPTAEVLAGIAEVPILPAGALHKLAQAPVGTGPYRVVDGSEGSIVLERFADYQGDLPSIERIEFVTGLDAAEALVAARQGDIDVIPELIRSHYPDQVETPAIASEFAALRLAPPVMRYLAVNTSRPPFDDPALRRAVSLAIDRSELVSRVYGGLARPIASPVWPGGPGHGVEVDAPERDVRRARALVLAARTNDAPVTIELLVQRPVKDDPELALVAGWLEEAGFAVTTRVGTAAVLDNRLGKGDFDMVLVKWSGRAADDPCRLVTEGGDANHGRFASDEAAALCAELADTWRYDERPTLVTRLGQIMASELPVIPLTAPDPYGLVHRRVKNVQTSDGWLRLSALRFD